MSSGQSFGSQGFRDQQQRASGGFSTIRGLPQSSNGAPRRREVRVEDALLYLEQVQQQFGVQSDTYAQFMDIMKDFKMEAYVLLCTIAVLYEDIVVHGAES